jgi:hypothetical protein
LILAVRFSRDFAGGSDEALHGWGGSRILLPECLDDWIDESNPVRAVDAFVDALDLAHLKSGAGRSSRRASRGI